MSTFGKPEKAERTTIKVQTNGKHFASHTVYASPAVVNAAIQQALHKLVEDSRSPQVCQ